MKLTNREPESRPPTAGNQPQATGNRKQATGNLMAGSLLFYTFVADEADEDSEACLRYTIEARELTNEYTHRPAYDVHSRRMFVEATDADDAISSYVRDSEAELVSFTRPGRGQESIATVKKEDTVFLVRIYAG